MKTEYFTLCHPHPPPPPNRERSRRRDHAGEPSGAVDTAGGAARLDATTRRRPRALSSPARSAARAPGWKEARARSPSASPPSPARDPTPVPGPQPPDTPGNATSTVGGAETTRAYFSSRPPAAPLWLVPLAAPLPAPLLAPLPTPLPAPLSTACVSPDIYLIRTTCEKVDNYLPDNLNCQESLTERNDSECREASVEASPRDTELETTLRLSRSTAFSTHFSPPRNVAVQTQRNLRTIPSDESEHCSLVCYDKSREWAGRLRDGHVRLALRALRQLRRAERLHRALTRAAPPAPRTRRAP